MFEHIPLSLQVDDDMSPAARNRAIMSQQDAAESMDGLLNSLHNTYLAERSLASRGGLDKFYTIKEKRCRVCCVTSVSGDREPHITWHLPAPHPGDEEKSLQQLVNATLIGECLGEEAINCEAGLCGRENKRDHDYRFCFQGKIPENIIILVKRLGFDASNRRVKQKTTCRIDQFLVFETEMDEGSEEEATTTRRGPSQRPLLEELRELKWLIVHIGSASEGHYIIIISTGDGGWLSYSDSDPC